MADPQFLTVPHLGRKKLARLFSKIAVQPNGCWIWTGCRDQNGYGKTSIRCEQVPVHRLLYAWCVGPLPRGVGADIPCLDHAACDTPPCCNPAHLSLVLPRENLLRGKGAPARNSRKTHCKRGHELPTPNDAGHRLCRICGKAQTDAYYATHRDEVIARTGAYAASKPADERKARRRAYYLANKESALAQGRDYYSANRDAVLARTGEYQRTHRKTSRARTKT